MCDKLTGEISKLRKEVFELQQELKLLLCKQSRSLWYEKKKTQPKQEKKKGKKSDNVVVHIDGDDKVISTDAKVLITYHLSQGQRNHLYPFCF